MTNLLILLVLLILALQEKEGQLKAEDQVELVLMQIPMLMTLGHKIGLTTLRRSLPKN